MKDTINKVVRLGTVPVYDGGERRESAFAKITYQDGRLSISGAIGPMRNGDSLGSCGQWIMSFREYDSRATQSIAEIAPAPGWTMETIRQFLDVWDRWHLNDMRAGCEHQRAIDTRRKVEVVSYKLTHEAMRLRDETRKAAADAALRGETFEPTPTARALAEMEDWFRDRYSPPDADSPLSGCYEVAKREQMAIGWTYPNEHPDGLLTKPCDVCGYEYGSAWLREDIPVNVLEFLRSLPETDIQPAWV